MQKWTWQDLKTGWWGESKELKMTFSGSGRRLLTEMECRRRGTVEGKIVLGLWQQAWEESLLKQV